MLNFIKENWRFILAGGLLGGLLVLMGWMVVYSDCRQVRIYNQLHQTAWTCSDYFWAKDVIK